MVPTSGGSKEMSNDNVAKEEDRTTRTTGTALVYKLYGAKTVSL